jgi:dihydroorotase
MNPPLRSHGDREKIREALHDGTLDAIATDHAPHSILEKELEFDIAYNGIIGLETSLPLSLELVRAGVITEMRLVELMSTAPAKILGVSGGSLNSGDPADVTVIDPDKIFLYNEESVVSKSHNSPFLEREFMGKADLTLKGGEVTHGNLS